MRWMDMDEMGMSFEGVISRILISGFLSFLSFPMCGFLFPSRHILGFSSCIIGKQSDILATS